MQVIDLTEGADHIWGFIPSFLHEDDPRSVREQFNERYISGWQPFKGFKLNPDNMMLSYPGDPPMEPISMMTFRNEVIYMYPHAWVLVMQHDKTWEACRMD